MSGEERVEPPEILLVVAAPPGHACQMWTGPEPTRCEHDAEYLFVYDGNLDPDVVTRRNAFACADCLPEPDDSAVAVRTDGGIGRGGSDRQELLRTVRTRRDKVLRFDASEDGGSFTWFVAYYGRYGWSACRANGEWSDDPTDDDVRYAFDEYDRVELVDRSELPEEVAL